MKNQSSLVSVPIKFKGKKYRLDFAARSAEPFQAVIKGKNYYQIARYTVFKSLSIPKA